MVSTIDHTGPRDAAAGLTYPSTIGGLPAILIVVSHFVEVVFIQLADEAGKIAVFEVFGQDGFGESLVLRGRWSVIRFPASQLSSGRPCTTYFEHDKASTVITPSHDLCIGRILQHSGSRCQPGIRDREAHGWGKRRTCTAFAPKSKEV